MSEQTHETAETTEQETAPVVAQEDGEDETTPAPSIGDGDEDEGEGADQDETEQQAVPIAPDHRTPEQIEAAQASWDRERDRHLKELKKRDDVRYSMSEACPLCQGHGLIYPILPEPEQTMRRDYIHAALGGQPEAQYLEHPSERRCETCDGWGQLETGSRVPNQDLLNCPACNGTGHRTPAPQAQVVPLPAAATGVPSDPDSGLPYSTVPMSEQVRIGLDAWGRQPGHPHYGVLRPNPQSTQTA